MRVSIQDAILPSTTLEIQRGADRGLTLTFLTDAGASASVLRAHGDALASHVQTQTGTPISVRLSEPGNANQIVGGGGADDGSDAGDGQSRGRDDAEARARGRCRRESPNHERNGGRVAGSSDLAASADGRSKSTQLVRGSITRQGVERRRRRGSVAVSRRRTARSAKTMAFFVVIVMAGAQVSSRAGRRAVRGGFGGAAASVGAEEVPEFLLRAALAGLMEERGLAALRLREIKRGAMCGGDGGVAVPLRLVCEGEEVSRGVWYGGVDFPFGGCAAALMSRGGVSPPDIWVGMELNAGAAELRINEFTDLDEGDVIFVEG